MNPDSPHFASSNLEQDTAPLAPGEVQTGERQSRERRKWVHNSDFSSLTFMGFGFCRVDLSQHDRWSLLHHPHAWFTPGVMHRSQGRKRFWQGVWSSLTSFLLGSVVAVI